MIVPFSSNDKNEFGRHTITRGGLLLDTIMQGRKRESQCKLLQMPAEILAVIVDLLAGDTPSLASLALVSSDCCHLARSYQFAEIHFDYSSRAQQFLTHLAEEALRKTDVTTRTFPIGICVRRVRFASRPECVIACHQELYDSIFSDSASLYSPEQREKLLQEAGEQYAAFRNRSVLAITRVMPNLEVLTWEDQFPMDNKFLNAISQCSAHHIKLEKVKIGGSLLMKAPSISALWPLRSVDLDIRLAQGLEADWLEAGLLQGHASSQELDNPMSEFCKTLFQGCAATLESLTWRRMGRWSRGRISLGLYPLHFPLLRYLRFGPVLLSPLAFTSLLSPSLKYLELPSSMDNLGECLVASEPLRRLESLIISRLPLQSQECDYVAEFIRRHKHVNKLLVHEPDSHLRGSTHLSRIIVPILAEGGFNNLRCLSLAWGRESMGSVTRSHEIYIPDSALTTLGSIVSLEQLSLRAGNNNRWGNKWLVSHDKLRQYLGNLSRLKMLALGCDTYTITSFNHINAENYYDLRLVGKSEHKEARARENLGFSGALEVVDTCDTIENERHEGEDLVKIWERAHLNRMLAEAEAYAAIFPALEWILCGQRPIGLQCNTKSLEPYKLAIPLTQYRHECYDFLDKTFGISQ